MTRSSPLSSPVAGSSGATEASPLTASTRPAVEIRPLRTMAECNECVELQRHVWGFGAADLVPATLLHVVDHAGGVAAGAFDSTGALLGFVFGISGVRDGELVHWSHMLGVRESARNLGLGRMLKEYQRAALAKIGVRKISWSFDPLMAKNAYFNFDRLGASVVEYVPDMYGTTASPLHLGLPTDRIVVTTPTSPFEAEHRPTRRGVLQVLSPFPHKDDDVLRRGADEHQPEALLIEVPSDILDVTRRSVNVARQWRLAVREHFLWALGAGYAVESVRRDSAMDREFYVLGRR